MFWVLPNISFFFWLFLFDVYFVSSGFTSRCCFEQIMSCNRKVIIFLNVKSLCLYVVTALLLLLLINFVVFVFELILLICAVFVVVAALNKL